MTATAHQNVGIEDVQRALANATARREVLGPIRLDGLRRIPAHVPEDMTVTAEAGVTLADLQARLAEAGQWLPVDPPDAGRLTVGELLATDASGPRRLGHGTVRDWLLGIAVVLADGQLIRSGGKVVKNVAGFDLLKLFVGSHGSLGVIVEATFKVAPLPESEQFVLRRCASLDEAGATLDAILEAPLTPVALDLHNPGAAPGALQLVAGFAGAREDVEWQLAEAAKLGFTESGSLDLDRAFHGPASQPPPRRLSVLPSRLVETLRQLGPGPFVARAGNGVIYHRGPESTATPPSPTVAELQRRLKAAFDPAGILPALPA